VFTDFVRDGPLVAFFARLRAEEYLFASGGPLGTTALFLPAVQANDHLQVPLGQGNRIDRRLADPSGPEQVRDYAINDFDDFLA
jgi:hypothetical protein